MTVCQQTLPLVVTAGTECTNSDLCIEISEQQAAYRDKLYAHGAILFRGFNVDQARFAKLTTILTSELLPYQGGDTPRSKLDRNTYTSTEWPADQFIPLHQEMSYTEQHPGIVYFACIIEPQGGGETPLLDARVLYQQLDSTITTAFFEKKLCYITNLHDGVGLGKSWQNYFETQSQAEVNQILTDKGAKFEWRNDGVLSFKEIVQPIKKHPFTEDLCFFSQADQWHPSHLSAEDYQDLLDLVGLENFYHHCTYADGSAIPEAFLADIRQKKEKLLQTFTWQKGDFLMVDNTAVMHGRMPFIGPRKIIVAMG